MKPARDWARTGMDGNAFRSPDRNALNYSGNARKSRGRPSPAEGAAGAPGPAGGTGPRRRLARRNLEALGVVAIELEVFLGHLVAHGQLVGRHVPVGVRPAAGLH